MLSQTGVHFLTTRTAINAQERITMTNPTYKAAEAGIPFVVIKDKASPVTIGKDIQVATKAVRKVKRTIKEATL